MTADCIIVVKYEMVMFMAMIQREYKDRPFQFIFGSEENKAWTLSLYNAVNGTDYSDSEKVQINTIKEVLYLGMHNDTSFLLTDDMNLYEQQSSYNPNMPVRMMQYAGNLYEKYMKENGLKGAVNASGSEADSILQWREGHRGRDDPETERFLSGGSKA